MLEDKDGKIWIGTEAGVCLYDGKTLTCFTTKDRLINNDVWSIWEDRAGNLWVGTRNTGLCSYDGKTFTHFTANDGQ